jgi:uncharacterized protein YukE
MAEGFAVKEAHVAGFSGLADDLSMQAADLMGHAHNEACATSGFTGLMQLVKTPVDAYAQATTLRLADKVDRFNGMSNELLRAAWVYSGADQSVYEMHGGPVPGQVTGYRRFPDPEAYRVRTPLALEVPGHEEADVRALLDEVGGSLNVIDDVVSYITGWSPVTEIVSPLSGNWTELSRAGEVLTQTGNGAETLAANLTAALAQLDPHWDGGAALSFQSYAERLSRAIEVEGPLNRLVAYVYEQVAGEFEKAAQFMVTTLKAAVDKVATAVATGWVPFFGWYKAYNAVRTVINVFQEAKQLIDSLKTLIEQVQTVVDAVEDPAGWAQGALEEKLSPITDAVEQGQQAVDLGRDLADLAAGADDLANSPDGNYHLGGRPRRDG